MTRQREWVDFGWRQEIPKVCGQCRRDLEETPDGWVHQADSTPRCPPGMAEAWRRIVLLVTGRYEYGI